MEWFLIGDGEEALNEFMALHGFVRFGSITGTSPDVIYVKDYLEEFRDFKNINLGIQGE